MNKLLDYIISLTQLQGLIHKEKLLEIYNLQNEVQATIEEVSILLENLPEYLKENFVYSHHDYFVHETIMEFDEFDIQLIQRKGKPFYIPDKKELLKYKEDGYFEKNSQYKKLLSYVLKNLVHGDKEQAESLCEDVQGFCQVGFKVQDVFKTFNHYEIKFKDEKQIHEVMQLVMDLANNTRIWENNGHTPQEIFELQEKPKLRKLPKEPFDFGGGDSNVIEFKSQEKIGRNDPCPCGSGKKYKKCCLNNH